ncbi:hypothetical protein [Sphingomonas sanguinis]|uniref:hypothetical protein n=1 Tax=Sphingomonas sanguinis TaxID=33051 RepID=UPI00128F8827|nr:hypothetical protein [Sphingomonas sanguinis]
MSFTEAEKQHWHTARKAGLDPEDYSPEELAAELKSQEANDDGDEGIAASSVCEHCGHALPQPSTAEFPLCHACQG